MLPPVLDDTLRRELHSVDQIRSWAEALKGEQQVGAINGALVIGMLQTYAKLVEATRQAEGAHVYHFCATCTYRDLKGATTQRTATGVLELDGPVCDDRGYQAVREMVGERTARNGETPLLVNVINLSYLGFHARPSVSQQHRSVS